MNQSLEWFLNQERKTLVLDSKGSETNESLLKLLQIGITIRDQEDAKDLYDLHIQRGMTFKIKEEKNEQRFD